MDSAGKKVLFLCTKDAIMTNALMNKIRLKGGDPVPVHDAQQLESCGDQPFTAIVYYINDDVVECAQLHSALDAFCARRGMGAVCVGAKEQYEIFLRDFPSTHAATFFERPLNMEPFLDCVLGGQDAEARKKRVLIVDDDANYREFVCDWLRSAYEVSLANGGEQALKILSTQKCDLVLLDFEMPVLSGPETMERIRTLPEGNKPKVVFLTGNEDAERIRQVLAMHPAGYLIKTVNREQLLAKVGEVLGGA